MHGTPKGETKTLTFAVNGEEKDKIRRLAAEYGARVGRPVAVGEYVRKSALKELQMPSAA